MRLWALIAALLCVAPAALGCSVPPWTGTRSTGAEGAAPVASATGPDGAAVVAWFDDPTTRYPHAVLGDAIEAGSLGLFTPETSASCGERVVLDPDHVFEDLAPRLADINGDGRLDAVVVRSHAAKGAQLAVYDGDVAPGAAPKLLAATPYIGQRNRWLAPAAIADFDRDGRMDIAYVETPHLGKTLRFWTYDGRKLVATGALQGVTNHRIGEDFISSAIRICGGRPEVLLANANWTRLIAARMTSDGVGFEDLGPWEGRSGFARHACQ